MRAFARWRALAWNEKRLTLNSALAVSAAVAGLRLAGVQRMLRAAAREPRGGSLTSNQIRDRVTAVDRAGRYVPGATCLSRSLALAWVLRGLGVAAAVRIGVRTHGRFDAHAWVECDGVAITEPSGVDDRFATILSS